MSSTRDKPERPVVPNEAKRGGDEAFLRRWSRRKQEARAQPVTVPPAEPPQAAESPKEPEKVLTDADMPPVESLNEKSDFSLFMSAGVSEELRRRALRKLFELPSINQRCPLDGEWYDCHGFEPLGNIITHEMREEMEREALKLKESAMELLEGKKAPSDATPPPLANAEGGSACADTPAGAPEIESATTAQPNPESRTPKENSA